MYIPTDANDPLVTFEPGFDTSAFFQWVDKNDFKRGAIQKAKLYIDIENFLNLLNDDMGTKRYINTTDNASSVAVVSTDIDTVNNTFVFQEFTPPETLPDTFDSLWRIQVGVRADF